MEIEVKEAFIAGNPGCRMGWDPRTVRVEGHRERMESKHPALACTSNQRERGTWEARKVS